MSWPHVFANESGNVSASQLDDNFNAATPLATTTALSATVAALPSNATPLIPVAAGTSGVGATLSRTDHQHPPQSAAPNLQTGASYTLQATDDGGVVELSNAASIALTVPNSLAVGFSCLVTQVGAGQITFTAASGTTLHNSLGANKSRTQWSVTTLYVRANSGGSSAECVLAGDMTV